MITCFCPHCFQEIQFSPARAGLQSACPVCRGPVLVPGTPAPPEPPPAPPPPGSSCPCPTCGHKLRFPASLAGKTGQCPRCAHRFILPGGPSPEPRTVPAPRPEPAEPEVTCFCPHCNKELHIPARHGGKIGTCPGCQGKFTIPGEQVHEVGVTIVEDEPPKPRRPRRRRRKSVYEDEDDYDERPYRSRRGGDPDTGKAIIVIFVIIIFLGDVLNIIVSLSAAGGPGGGGGAGPGAGGGVAGGVGMGFGFLVRWSLLISLINGSNGARLFFGFANTLAGLCCGVLGVAAVAAKAGLPALVLLAIGGFNLAFGLTLLLSPSVKAYTEG